MGASVETVFSIEDQVSSKLQAMVKNAGTFEMELRKLEQEAKSAFKPDWAVQFNNTIKATEAHMKRTSVLTNDMTHSMSGFKGSLNGASDRASLLATNLAKGAAILYSMKKAVDGFMGFANYSDDVSLLNSRLLLATDNTLTLAETQDLVMKKARDTGADYMILADTVGRIGVNANDAFKNTEEAINFAGALNQSFTLGGASAEEISGATKQMTQALASGVLRGDELNSVMEGAPLIAEALSKKLGITKGEIRDLAADGKISAQVVKEAVLENADEINKKFQQLNGTLGGTIKNGIKNSLTEAFREPALALNNLFNSESFMTVASGVTNTLAVVASGVTFVINLAGAGLDFVTEHWHGVSRAAMLTGIIIGTVVAGNFVRSNWAIIKGLRELIKYETAVGFAAMKAWAMANWPFVLAGAAIFGIIMLLGKMGVTFEDVAGIAGGAFSAIFTIGKNVMIGLTKVYSVFFSFILSKFEKTLYIAEKVASAISGKKVVFKGAHEAIGRSQDFLIQAAGMEFSSIGDAWQRGKQSGKNLWNQLKSFKNPMDSLKGNAAFGSGIGILKTDDDTKNGIDKIKDNTDKIKDSLSEGIENLSYLMKQALTQRVTYITNNNKLDVRNEFNHPDGSFDIDGLGSTLGNSLLEAINSGNGGVAEYVG